LFPAKAWRWFWVIVGSYFPQKPGAVFGNVGMNWKIKQDPSFNLVFRINYEMPTSRLQAGFQFQILLYFYQKIPDNHDFL
jgi:hypothetical protein